MSRYLFLFLLPIIWVSCGETSEEKIIQSNVQDTVFFGSNKYPFPQLSKNAKEQIENWPIYDDFYAEASALNQINIEDL